MHIRIILMFGTFVASAAAQDADSSDGQGQIGIAPGIMVGSSGFEPGLAFEIQAETVTIRPELILSEDERIGAGVALLWDLTTRANLDPGQRIETGPRLLHHDADDHGWEIDGMLVWSLAIGQKRSWRHAVEMIGAVGLVDERHDAGAAIGFNLGLAYVFRL